MSISLKKGQKISLTKDNAGLSKITVGLGWDEAEKGGLFKRSAAIDCDASVFMLQGGQLVSRDDTIYFGNLCHKSNSVRHTGDNLTGAGEGDDEQIKVDLSKIPEEYDRLVFVVNIFAGAERNQHFGMIKNAFIRIVDDSTGKELCQYSLTDDYSGILAMIFGEVYRNNGEWKFNAIGQGTGDSSIADLEQRYR